MKVLVIGGMHGNEPLGIEVVKLFQGNPVENVEVMLANEQAVTASSRFVKQDLNRSFPGNEKSKVYEQERAAELLKLASKYDIVLDFHNTYCPNNDCGFVGENASQKLYEVAWLLGFKRIVVAEYDCINKFATNCLSVEVSLDSPLNCSELWYERISMFSKLEDFNVKLGIEKYRFVYRITLEDKVKYELPAKKLKAFEPLDMVLTKEMGVDGTAYPIFIADKFTPYNYGGLLNKIA